MAAITIFRNVKFSVSQERVDNSMNKVISESIKNTKIPRNIVNERVEFLPLKKFDCYRNALETMRSKCLTEKVGFVLIFYFLNSMLKRN